MKALATGRYDREHDLNLDHLKGQQFVCKRTKNTVLQAGWNFVTSVPVFGKLQHRSDLPTSIENCLPAGNM